ncbi:recombinase family protein [Ruicaihuangia caeni]|uniref:Recombinase family protein n=1 Tax=Ruicaihuangia caeni TaxID=3042517 RepID=A0AAW6T174_9MICO|nr:recombinase family protein [Klugiella sp. YN-L-19]MDI2097566.1 recombinase family protein [Klugiella sp. YN-L-19]
MSKPSSAAIYARISSDTTGEGLGVQRQLEDCRKLAADRGWQVAEEYVDNDISAYSGKIRPAYQRMLQDMAAGLRDAVIMYNSDRLTRQPIELEEFIRVCDQAGIEQVASVSADFNIGTDDGLFNLRIMAAFAAKESGRKSARQKRQIQQRAEAGLPGGGSTRPFGYEPDKITIRESEATIVRSLVDRFLAGESTRSLAIWLNDSGIPTSSGTARWASQTVRGMLRGPRLAGLRVHQGAIIGKGIWQPIISEEVHARILAEFDKRKTSQHRAPRRYLLSGMLRCGNCGAKLNSAAKHSATRSETRRYVCTADPRTGGCGRLTVVAAPVEEWLTEAVLYRLDSPDLAAALTGQAHEDAERDALMEELQADRAQKDELARMWANREIASADWKSAREPIEVRIAATERRLHQMQGTEGVAQIAGTGDEIRASWASLNLERQSAIIKALLDFATIKPGKRGAQSLDPSRVVPTWRL